MNFAKFLRAPFFTDHLRWLLLKIIVRVKKFNHPFMGKSQCVWFEIWNQHFQVKINLQSLIPLFLQFLWDLIQKHYSTSLIFRKRRLPVIRITYVAFVHLAKHRSPSQFSWAPDEARLEYYFIDKNGKKVRMVAFVQKFVHEICSWNLFMNLFASGYNLFSLGWKCKRNLNNV